MNKVNLTEQIKKAMKEDFDALYRPGFTTTWEAEQVVRHLEIDVMSIEHLLRLVEEESDA